MKLGKSYNIYVYEISFLNSVQILLLLSPIFADTLSTKVILSILDKKLSWKYKISELLKVV